MSTILKYTFPAANTQDVCLTQSTTGALNLVLNGNLASNNTVPFINNGYSRQVSFTSANNLSSATFTITGLQNGVQVSETLSGPNNDSVYSAGTYDIIFSISVNTIVIDVSVGSGYNGFFPLIPVDLTQLDINYTLSLGSLVSSNQINTTIYTTLDNILDNGLIFSNIITDNVGTLFEVKAASSANLYILPVAPATSVAICRSILIQLTGSTSTLANGITLIFIQT